jgi:hypothetical protein
LVVFLALGLSAPSMLAKNCCCSFIMSPAMSNHAVTALDMSGVGARALMLVDVADLARSVTCSPRPTPGRHPSCAD